MKAHDTWIRVAIEELHCAAFDFGDEVPKFLIAWRGMSWESSVDLGLEMFCCSHGLIMRRLEIMMKRINHESIVVKMYRRFMTCLFADGLVASDGQATEI